MRACREVKLHVELQKINGETEQILREIPVNSNFKSMEMNDSTRRIGVNVAG